MKNFILMATSNTKPGDVSVFCADGKGWCSLQSIAQSMRAQVHETRPEPPLRLAVLETTTANVLLADAKASYLNRDWGIYKVELEPDTEAFGS